MSTIVGVDLDSSTLASLRDLGAGVEIQCAASPDEALRLLEGGRIDALVLGPRLSAPVHVVQKASTIASDVAIVVLADPEGMSLLRQALRFAPYIRREVQCTLSTDPAEMLSTVRAAIADTNQRRSYRSTIAQLNTQLAAGSPPPLKSDSYLQRLLELAPVGVIVTDEQGLIFDCNLRASQLLEGSERELRGQRLPHGTGELEHRLWRRNKKDGSAQVLEVIDGAMSGHGGEAGRIVLLQDRTDEHEAREAREAALLQAEEAVRLRDDFMAIAAHELRTPLTALLLKLEATARKVRAHPPDLEHIAARVEDATRHSQRLSRLIEQLLDVSRITASQLTLHPEPVELNALIARIIEQQAEATRQAHCTIILDAPAPAPGLWDPLRLEQMVENLLGNAVKYAPGKTIHIQTTTDGTTATLSITDPGIGIPLDVQKTIFEKFYRAVPLRNYGGLGLGLYIVKQIVDAMMGTIRVVSDGRSFTTFVLTLPCCPPAPAAAIDSGAA